MMLMTSLVHLLNKEPSILKPPSNPLLTMMQVQPMTLYSDANVSENLALFARDASCEFLLLFCADPSAANPPQDQELWK
jgi:hypothetical protein